MSFFDMNRQSQAVGHRGHVELDSRFVPDTRQALQHDTHEDMRAQVGQESDERHFPVSPAYLQDRPGSAPAAPGYITHYSPTSLQAVTPAQSGQASPVDSIHLTQPLTGQDRSQHETERVMQLVSLQYQLTPADYNHIQWLVLRGFVDELQALDYASRVGTQRVQGGALVGENASLLPPPAPAPMPAPAPPPCPAPPVKVVDMMHTCGHMLEPPNITAGMAQGAPLWVEPSSGFQSPVPTRQPERFQISSPRVNPALSHGSGATEPINS